MKSSLMIACASLAIGASLAFAQDENSVGYSDVAVDGVQNPLRGSLSFRGGYFDQKGAEDVDTSAGAAMEFRLALGDSPFDLVLRGNYGFMTLDDYYTRIQGVTVKITDTEWSTFGGSAQLQYNFDRNGFVNPYISVGAVYDKWEEEFDYTYATSGRSGNWIYAARVVGHDSVDDDGSAFVGRAGVEINPVPFYLRFEAAYLSEIYEDDAQAELSAIVGWNVIENLRLDVAVSYYTEWEETYVLVGASWLF